MKIKLNSKRQAWAEQFKPDKIKGGVLHHNAAVEDRYRVALEKLIARMTAETKREIKKLFLSEPAKEHFAEDASIASQARILTNALEDRFKSLFASVSKPLAEKMAADADRASKTSIGSSLKDVAAGLTLKGDVYGAEISEIMTATVAENVSLIRSIPERYFDQIQGAVMRSITTGGGLSELVPFINQYEGVTIRRARLIASDQTKKAKANIDRARMVKMGIEEYEWVHSGGGQEPRKLHLALNGRIFRYDDPPIADEKTGFRCGPGVLINCRCVARPIIRFNDGEA